MKNEMHNMSATSAFAMGIQTGGFKGRLFGYFMFYIPVAFVSIILAALFEETHRFVPFGIKAIDTAVFLVIISIVSALPFILWERSIRKFRRANGLSVFGNIAQELEQREIDERIRKEHKAFVNNGLVKDGGIDKNDIGYWFGLFERGAISKEEYEAKKAELMK